LQPDKEKLTAAIESLLPSAMIADRASAVRRLSRMKAIEKKKNLSKTTDRDTLQRIKDQLERSAETCAWRRKNIPLVSYPPSLPITAKKNDIIEAIKRNPVVIISGETGSGKTTQIPKFCLEALRGISGIIGCTQPRRIAATTVSHRIAEELGEEIGRSVGYKIRFKDKTGENAFIKIMTDGILLAETQMDPRLNAYDTIIVDEAHERSLNIDFVLGILKLLSSRRNDLKLIISSATIDTKKFSRAFHDAPVIEVSGRMFPVETRYVGCTADPKENDDASHVEAAVKAMTKIQHETPFGDVLIFMPTEQDILETCELIEGRKFHNVSVLPLFARLSALEQKRVFSRSGKRKIIVATNIAETSITIPGIKYVIDSGLARISQYSPRSRITALPVLPVSQSSADQRKGRCGRIENGVCIRLFSEEDYSNRPRYTQPEILRANLAEVILRMLFLKLGSVEAFPFIDKPAAKSIRDGYNLLLELGAIERKLPQLRNTGKKAGENSRGKFSLDQFHLTTMGKFMAKIPIDPRLSRIIFEADKLGCLTEISIIAAALSAQDPRERPMEKIHAADEAHKVFSDGQSDFISLLNIWDHYHGAMESKKSAGQLKKYCKAHFLSFKRMREWQDIYRQLSLILKDNRLTTATAEPAKRFPTRQRYRHLYTAIHRSILSGFLSHIAQKVDKQYFKAAGDKEVMIFPGSGLFKNPGEWIVAAEMVETSRLFARTVATIEKEWLEDYGRALCRYSYQDPHWDGERGEVVADEQVTLFGLIIVPRRRVSFGKIHPETAGDIFIRNALVRGELRQPFAFLRHNARLVKEIRETENRIRRRDILLDDETMVSFYKQRLDSVFDVRTLKSFLRRQGGDDFLKFTKEDLQQYLPDPDELQRYPQKVQAGNRVFECLYTFEPGNEADGISLKIPAGAAAVVEEASLDWVVPGLTKEKIAALLRGLPKKYRKKLVPLSATQERILREMPTKEGTLAASLSRFLYTRMGIDIPASAWPVDSLPDHLKLRFAVVDGENKILRAGRDPSILKSAAGLGRDASGLDALLTSWGKKEIQAWDFGDLPERVKLKDKNNLEWELFPALEAKDHAVDLRLFVEKSQADEAHKKGVRKLFMLHFSKELKFLKRNLTLPPSLKQAAQYFGGARPAETMIFQTVVDALFLKDIRTHRDFAARVDALQQQGIHLQGRETLGIVTQVLAAYAAVRTEIHQLEKANRNKDLILRFLAERREDLSKLVPENFITLYAPDKLLHILRYIKALSIRVQRGVVNLEKDRSREKDVLDFNSILADLIAHLSASASDNKRRAVEEFYWLLEEYKISVFAQELKTAVKISKKKLIEASRDIVRMI
jgi:ATP-dependent helicase HrpA